MARRLLIGLLLVFAACSNERKHPTPEAIRHLADSLFEGLPSEESMMILAAKNDIGIDTVKMVLGRYIQYTKDVWAANSALKNGDQFEYPTLDRALSDLFQHGIPRRTSALLIWEYRLHSDMASISDDVYRLTENIPPEGPDPRDESDW